MNSDDLAANRTMPLHAKAKLDHVGYVVLPNFAKGNSSELTASKLGEVIVLNGSVVQHLTPRATSTPNTYSGIFGLGQFPFHTDLAHWLLPPRYLLLRCVKGYGDVPTMLLDGLALIAEVGSETMSRALVMPRRPQSRKFRMLRLHQRHTGTEMIRWDQVFLRPASKLGVIAFEKVQAYLEGASQSDVSMVNDGDILIIDNWRMFHSRPAISVDRQDRHLERVYLRSLK